MSEKKNFWGGSIEKSYHVQNTLFWSDVWVGDVSLRVGFPRLSDLLLFQEVFVFDMCRLGWEVEGQAWLRKRRLLAWEEELVGELILLLHSASLQVDKIDRWHWNLEKSHVRSAYNLQTSQPSIAPTVAMSALWNKEVLSRSCCLRGVCFVTGCQQRIISFVVVWFLLIHGCVILVAIQWRLILIYFYTAIFLVRYVTWS